MLLTPGSKNNNSTKMTLNRQRRHTINSKEKDAPTARVQKAPSSTRFARNASRGFTAALIANESTGNRVTTSSVKRWPQTQRLKASEIIVAINQLNQSLFFIFLSTSSISSDLWCALFSTSYGIPAIFAT